MVNHHTGPSEGQESLEGFFKLVAIASPSKVGQILPPPALCGNPGGISHIYASMVCLQSNKVLGKKGLEEGEEIKRSLATINCIF